MEEQWQSIKKNRLTTELSTNSNISTFDENKLTKLQRLVAVIEDYLKNRTEDSAVLINKLLQALSYAIDLSIFDPHTNIASQFFVSLYDLMNKLEPRSQTAWYCVDVLSNACRNPSARQALISTYHFIPSLSRLLGDQLTTDKKTRLLKLMQDLSCGITMSWQVPHLPHLLSSLTKWVESQEEDIVTLSLGVLVNLCYKNIPVIYALSRIVDIKKFLRTCIPLKGPVIEIYVWKLMVILDHINSEIPNSFLFSLVDPTFKSISEACRMKDSILLRQVIEFFVDMLKLKSQGNPLRDYEKYDEEINTLLEVVENNSPIGSEASIPIEKIQDPECIALILEFIHTLINLKVSNISPLYPRIIQLCLKWIQEDTVSFQAIALLRTIAVNINKQNNCILESLIVALPIFLLMLNCRKEETIPTHTEYNKRLGALLQLLSAMLQVESIRPKVLEEVNEEMLNKIFVPLLGDDTPRISDADTWSMEAVGLYVHALTLVLELNKYDENWFTMGNNLMLNRHIHIIIAQALFNNTAEVKCLALEIATNPTFPRREVALAMSSIQTMFTSSQPSPCKSTSPSIMHQMSFPLNFPLLSVAQEQRLDGTLDRLKDLIVEKNVMDISTSKVMEIYEYKLASLGQAERAATANVEAASERCTHLQHRVAQLTAEQTRIHQLLYHTQQMHEETLKNKDKVLEQLRDAENKLQAVKGKLKATSSQLKVKEEQLKGCEETLENLREDLKKKLTELTNNKTELEEQNEKLIQVVKRLEENSTRLEKNLQKKEETLKKAHANIDSLKAEVHQLESNLRQKSQRLDEVQSQLQQKTQIIETITKVANSS